MRNLKTLGPVSANLIMTLMDRGKRMFRINDVMGITEKSQVQAADLLYHLVKRKVIIRLTKGKYMIIPTEAGTSSMYIENYYIVARELAEPRKYYLSYYSAMAIHDMLTQPITKVFISSPSRIRNVKINNIEFKFIFNNPKRFWGFKELWVTKQEKCLVSDIEKTILDCLFQPRNCGGVSEIVKGILMKKHDINYDRIIEYCQNFEAKAPVKRLGYIMEIFKMGEEKLSILRRISLSNSYIPLDPLLPKCGKHYSKWGLILNVKPDELKRVVET